MKDERNAELGIDCYCLDANYIMEGSLTHLMQHPNATTHTDFPLAYSEYNNYNRYINHAHVNYNLIVMPPIMTGEKLRIGFVAKQNISKARR